MERRGRGNGRGSRGRGQAQRDNQHGQPYHQQQQQQQQRPQSVDPPRQSAWGGRGRGNGAQNPRAAPSQVEQVSAGLQEMRVSRDAGAGDAPRAQPAAKTGEVSRGARRQGPPPEPRPVLKSSKQGKAGVGEMLKANYFNFAKIADMCCYQYRVDFLPDPDVTVIKKALLNVHKDDLGPAYLFDGTVLWTTHRVNEEKERVSMRQKTEEPVKIQIKLRTDISPKDPSYIHFLNVIMRKTLAMMEWKIINRDYFDPSGKVVLEQHQLEIWPGFSTSIRQHEAAVLLNVEVASKVMRRETAYDLLCNVRSRRSDAYKTDFEEEIIGQTVITPYNNTTYRIDDVDWDSSPNTTFDMKGNKVSFKEYYQNKYELRLRYPDQPLLVTKPTKRDIRAGKTTVPKLVPELCCLTGVDDNMRANFHLMKAIAEHTKVAPGLRVQRIENGFLKTLMTRPNTKGELQKWNMGFQPKVVEFSGRRLNPEEIIIGRQISVRPNVETADFTQGLTSQKAPLFATPALNRWVVIHPQRMPRQEIEKFVSTLQRACSTFKYSLAVPQYDQIANDRGATYAQSIENWINQRAEMVMCLVPQKRADRYEQIKKKCYVHRSIPSQVVVGKNVSRANMSVCTKIGIQMVCKQGGTPWTVKIPFKAPPMFVGFDVCHDTSSRERSFGALVASVNPAASRYASFVYPHKRGEEICPFIGQLMLKAVIVYQKKNDGALPTKIIFYRDGVGEGNYHYVQVQEVDGIKNALKQLYGDNVVPLVYVIVTKRINTRLFRANNSNPLPGTIADSCVTNPTLYDFFLVSQSVTEGTVAPTSYVVLADEIAIPPDHLQQLTYKLCHLYYNWSGTIRVPAPVQYAHKLAFLAGQSLHTTPQAAEQTMEDILYFL